MGRPGDRRALAGLACAIAIAVPIGCGGDDDGGGDQPSAEETAQQYVDAQNNGDAAAICSLYSDRLKDEIGAVRNCAAFVQEQTSGLETEFTLVRVDEDGDRATAVLTASSTEGEQNLEIELRRADGGWLITSLGGPTGS